jgi:UDP-N-acetylmuramyl pentapeptide phosphotransferase/UDP-N-acetylglucosamine-1-phosphate transferase
MIFFAPFVSILVTLSATAILLYSGVSRLIQDIPNERSLHSAPTPRIGGGALMIGLLSGWALTISSIEWWVALPMLLLFAISVLDDIHSLPVRSRLFAHLVSAMLLVYGSGIMAQDTLLAIAIVLATVWTTNLYNFMDGSDGLAGGMAVIGFTIYGAAAMIQGDELLAMLNFSIAAAALGFLYFNFYPARVFMGDAGSIPLGFLVAAMGVWGRQRGDWPIWFPLPVFSPFITDATVTLLKRAFRGEKIIEAHRDHYYQRLIRSGWGHRNVALLGYALMIVAGLSAIWSIRSSTDLPWLLLLIWGSIYAVLMTALDRRWRAFQRRQNG